MVFNGRIRRLVADEIDLDIFAGELAAVEDFDKCWELIRLNYAKFGFSQIELHGNQIKQDGAGSSSWYVQIDFHGRGHIRLFRNPDAKQPGASALLFIDCLARHLGPKLDEFAQFNTPRAEPVNFEAMAPARITLITE